MSERLRSVEVRVVIDTNKDTYRLKFELRDEPLVELMARVEESIRRLVGDL